MADNVEHSIQNQNVCLHLEIKHNWPIGNDITTQTKMAVDWTMLLVPSALQSSGDGSEDEVVGSNPHKHTKHESTIWTPTYGDF